MTRVLGLMPGLCALLIVGTPAAQTAYPEKPIRMVVGYPAGSPADTVARLLGQKLAEGLEKPIVVDNATAPPALSQPTAWRKQLRMATR